MNFLLEPLELGSELSDLFTNTALKIVCDTGVACEVGTIEK